MYLHLQYNILYMVQEQYYDIWMYYLSLLRLDIFKLYTMNYTTLQRECYL